jgi:hypothetical protein
MKGPASSLHISTETVDNFPKCHSTSVYVSHAIAGRGLGPELEKVITWRTSPPVLGGYIPPTQQEQHGPGGYEYHFQMCPATYLGFLRAAPGDE